ncbi:hypothetical protein [Salinibacter ruber]|uniref:hypothetical protein n=1 Tax=Salinibacter ruber TaxID=146919 RepID=UPI00216A341A|nr:hypothetical protein [Salinibacter ruber]MCS3702316.1 hypothetical protein [Salinibacter ruber]
MDLSFPDEKKFAFTVFDDTDNATVQNVKPVYDLLDNLGLRTTKSVWVCSPRDNFGGQTAEDEAYLDFLYELQKKGFELASHGVGSGTFSRREILDGFERFRELFGEYPRVHANHARNPDNLYWRPQDRFAFPFSLLVKGARHLKRSLPEEGGHVEDSPHFWGDWAKRHIEYVRDLTFNKVNTLACDPRMPYRHPEKQKYSNYWFSASDGHTVEEFNALTKPENIDRLEQEGGVCVVYTHFASGFVRDGIVDEQFAAQMRDLASRDSGWFVPVGKLLDYLREARDTSNRFPGRLYRWSVELRWLLDRVMKQWRWGR